MHKTTLNHSERLVQYLDAIYTMVCLPENENISHSLVYESPIFFFLRSLLNSCTEIYAATTRKEFSRRNHLRKLIPNEFAFF